MPRSAGTSVENNFSRGLITEATAMNYPENSVIETDNCVYLKNGTVLRRNGIDFEDNHEVHTFSSLGVLSDSIVPDYDNIAVNEFEWVTLNEDANKSFLVVQLGDVLRFFEIDSSNGSSYNLKDFSVKISDYRTTPELETDIATVTGNVLVDDTLVASLTGTLTVTRNTLSYTITFGAGDVNTLAEFLVALDEMAVELSMVSELDTNSFLHISTLPNDNSAFTISGSLDVFAVFGVNEQTYVSDTEDAFEAVARRRCSFSSGLGYMFVVHPFCEPFFIEYDSGDDNIVVTEISIEARDFERLEDGWGVSTRPDDLDELHRYNIYNQGWYATGIKAKETTPDTDNGPNVQVKDQFAIVRSEYPSNSDIWWLWKNSQERYDPSIETFAQLSTPAPNGHYLYSAFQTNRRTATNAVIDVPEKSSGAFRPSSTAFFASRVWYSGVNIEGFSSNIYFSKLIEGKQDFGKCYQEADPTSESLSDLQEIDGGVIVIPDVVKVTGLLPIGRYLLVFATNGIWAISGSQGGFKANDYSIQKIGASPVNSPNSIVLAESQPFWWSRSGIYTILIDPNSGELTVENISDLTIKTLVLSVPADNVEFIRGSYNSTDRTIQWLYRTSEALEDIQNYQYNKILVHDTASKSFYTHSIEESSAFISGALNTTKSTYDPLSSDDAASTTTYIVTGDFGESDARAITMAKFKDSTFKDWATVDSGVDFESYFITGYRVRAELLRKFQANYLVVMAKVDTENFDDYGCILQGLWDYNNSTNGRLTREQQVYLWSYNMDYSRRKLKMRGNGYSLQFKFKSQPGKKFVLTGWVSSESASNVP
jgi:hypothetical protein